MIVDSVTVNWPAVSVVSRRIVCAPSVNGSRWSPETLFTIAPSTFTIVLPSLATNSSVGVLFSTSPLTG